MILISSSKRIGMLCHNQGLTVEYYNIRKPLYDNYYLTDLGIFKFDRLLGYYGKQKVPVYIQDAILPKKSMRYR